jgi:hypothetical protein
MPPAGQKRERVMGHGEEIDLVGAVHPTVDFVELAAETAELLPDRMTLAVFGVGRTNVAPINPVYNSEGSNTSATINTSETNTLDNIDGLVQGFANAWTISNQWRG